MTAPCAEDDPLTWQTGKLTGRLGDVGKAACVGRARIGCAEIVFQTAPGAMNMVGGVARRVSLNVEELDDESRPLDAVGVRLARLGAAGEGEMDIVEAA